MTYVSPESFKPALEKLLRVSAKTGAEFVRRRQLLLRARPVAVHGDGSTLASPRRWRTCRLRPKCL